jgi:hypothetical protein
LPFDGLVSWATLFFGAAMAIPDERKVALSIPTQTAMKGLRDGLRNSICRTATKATFSKLISQVFEISGTAAEKIVIPA